MRPILIFLILLFTSSMVWAQKSVADLEKALDASTSAKERMMVQYDLSTAYLKKRDYKKSISYGRNSFKTATDNKNNGMAAEAAYLIGQVYLKDRDKRNAEIWFKTTLNYAKQAKDSDLIIKSVDQRSKLAIKKRDYRNAYKINQEAFDYFSGQKGKSISQLERNYDSQKVVLEKEKKKMEAEKDRLEAEISRLENDKEQLSSDKTALTRKQEVLLQEKDEVAKEIDEKDEALESLSRAKVKADRKIRRRDKEIQDLTKDALEQEVMLQEKEIALAQAELEQERGRNLLILLGVISLFIVLLAILFYARYRSKKRSANVLEEKNKTIEQERQRSDELLLNILPAPIAEELKENGKAKAQKFSQATVLLTDFKNFTKISERLTPEQLVKELDYCFRGFDFIITQHQIEKIKTIGDAYMCATGLNNRKTVPNKIIHAALEIQEFLEDYKQDRQKLGLPFFEARIGIHTGPVVAGVVGVNKFAYDIWGDTVNIASRLESNCQEGKINISSETYNLVRYQFDCDYRGKVAAKNKGEIDMYYVNAAKN